MQFLMDARLAIPTPKKLSFEQAASVGVGTEVIPISSIWISRGMYWLTSAKTAALGLYNGLEIKIPDPKALPEVKNEWVFILGGAGSVGQYAVQVCGMPVAMYSYICTAKAKINSQLAKISGYKVVATCSAKTVSVRHSG